MRKLKTRKIRWPTKFRTQILWFIIHCLCFPACLIMKGSTVDMTDIGLRLRIFFGPEGDGKELLFFFQSVPKFPFKIKILNLVLASIVNLKKSCWVSRWLLQKIENHQRILSRAVTRSDLCLEEYSGPRRQTEALLSSFIPSFISLCSSMYLTPIICWAHSDRKA